LSRFLTSYGEAHWTAGKQILRYLQETKELLYKRSKRTIISVADALVCYVDADNASDINTRRSTTGCVFLFEGAPLVWFSKKQTCIAMSSTESEYVALAEAGKEATWLLRMYADLDMKTDDPLTVYTDSHSALKLCYNPEYHPKTNHIDVKYDYIRHLTETRVLKIKHLPDQ